MARSTIDFGIDLGTTNSSIAVMNTLEVEVFKNNENHECTPSAIWVDKSGSLFVGLMAKNHQEDDPENSASEFKLQMGSTSAKRFSRSGREMKPEELSAEVLKSLKADVRQSTGEDVQAAVITVPAAFELPACEATNRAARLAGFTVSPLLQEPVAAAQAYGFQTKSEKAFWLVYDLGGGTFDAAVIRVRDGIIEVVNHGGDNHLGGKLLDWSIVDQLLIPALTSQYPLANFKRGNPKWTSAIAKLKLAAEIGKIQVSRRDKVHLSNESLCLDDEGRPVSLDFTLHAADVQRLAEPLIRQSITICKRVLAEQKLSPQNIEKVLLVGGPTLMPYLREMLADPSAGLGIALETSVDPMTVVSRGAAIFASNQPLPAESRAAVPVAQGTYRITFPDWKFVGNDTEPWAAGVVQAPDGKSAQGCTVEFANAESRPPWRSGKIGLATNGAFMTSLFAEKGRQNTFTVTLSDNQGRPLLVATEPESLTYKFGMIIESAPLTHSIGVGLANDEVAWLFRKGTPLQRDKPARSRCVLRTTVEVRRGQEGDLIRIPVIEGENSRASRNRRIGSLEIRAHEVQRNVPANSEVEFTIEIDVSRLVKATAYVPILDQEYERVMHLSAGQAADVETLHKEYRQEMARLQKARDRINQIDAPEAQATLRQIERDQLVETVETLMDAAGTDPDAADKCNKRLLDLKVAIDEVEDGLEWPGLVAEAEKVITASSEAIRDQGDRNDEQQRRNHETQVRNAIHSHDAELLRQRMEELRGFVLRILDRRGGLQLAYFQQLQQMSNEMTDPALARRLISQGTTAINAGDVEALRAVNRQLIGLLRTPPPNIDVSTVIR